MQNSPLESIAQLLGCHDVGMPVLEWRRARQHPPLVTIPPEGTSTQVHGVLLRSKRPPDINVGPRCRVP
eukprot:498566-Pyramimonas_sp.AAC.1